MLGILGIEESRVVVEVHTNQALLTLIGDHITAGADVFDRLGIAETGERYPPQYAPVQRQLNQLRTLIGHGEQAVAVRIEGECGDIVIQPFEGLCLDRHAILVQTDAQLGGLPPGLDIEPAALEQAVLLPRYDNQQQGEQAQNQENQWQADVAAHSGRLDKEQPESNHTQLKPNLIFE
ncbi:hypothetical protein D3C84_594510 [compost metagenome]